MLRKEFTSYEKMMKYLSRCENLDKADFEFKNGIWILNIVRFDKCNE